MSTTAEQSQDVTRASTICLINSIAAGRTMIRSELAIKFAERLCSGPPLKGIPMYGGTGVGDVAQLPLLDKHENNISKKFVVNALHQTVLLL